MKIISLHLPKTAGTSFGKSLEDAFGNSLLKDYEDKGISKPVFERNKHALVSSMEIASQGLANVDCVHGHFLPVKYLLLNTIQNLTYVTWMRDPIQRMISHYTYWQRSYDPRTAAPHHKQVIEEKWSLEQFCLDPKFRNIYSQYLWAFPLENFDFIGITEHYEDDFFYFSKKYLSGTLDHKQLNIGRNIADGYSIEIALREKVESYHEQDIALYNRALELRLTRASSY